MRRRPARSRILKKSPRAPGGDRARSRRRRRSPRGLVRRRGPHRPEEQDHPAMGQTGLAAERPERPANRLSLHLRDDLPEGRQGRGARHAPLRHRGDEPASGRNRHADRARRPRRAAHRSGRLASLRPPRRPAQHHAHLAARKVPRTEPAGKRMAVHARQLAVEPSLQILRRHRQPLLRRLEQARRSALENHLHRNARLGVWVLISESWYKTRERVIEREAGAPAIGENDHFVVESENGDFSDPSARRTKTYAPSIWRSSCDRRHTAWRERCFSPRSPGSLLERLVWSSQSRAFDLPALGLVLVLVPRAIPPDRPRKTALMRQRTHALQRAHRSAEPARRRPRDHLLCELTIP